MKAYILFWLASFCCCLSFSQANIKLSSIDNGGGSFNTGTLSVIATVGETAIREYSANTLNVSEGFIGALQLNNQTQNLNCITPPNNLIAFWKAEDNTNDSAGNNNGTGNGVVYGTGVVNKSFSFDGVNDVVVVPHSTDLDITGNITVEFWALQTVFNTENTVLCKGSEDAENAYSIRFTGQTFECVFKDNLGNDVVLVGPSFEDFQWHHYAYVRQGNQHQIYADGFGFGWMPFTNSPLNSVGLPLTIGAQYNSQNTNYTNFFGGQIDEVSIYNRALSELEIQSVYNAGADGKCINTLSLENELIVENEIKIYPNPVKDVLNVKLNSEHQNVTLEIYDALGKRVKYILKLPSASVNVETLNSGLYFYRIKAGNKPIKLGKLMKR
ncbi:MAG: LamG-like jellyroll fold domain-containing protein [Jejuia sp.]